MSDYFKTSKNSKVMRVSGLSTTDSPNDTSISVSTYASIVDAAIYLDGTSRATSIEDCFKETERLNKELQERLEISIRRNNLINALKRLL